jgi:hypothetical protein
VIPLEITDEEIADELFKAKNYYNEARAICRGKAHKRSKQYFGGSR